MHLLLEFFSNSARHILLGRAELSKYTYALLSAGNSSLQRENVITRNVSSLVFLGTDLDTFQLWLPGFISAFAGSGFTFSRDTLAVGPGDHSPPRDPGPAVPLGETASFDRGVGLPLAPLHRPPCCPAVLPDRLVAPPIENRLFPDGTHGDETGQEAFPRGCYTYAAAPRVCSTRRAVLQQVTPRPAASLCPWAHGVRPRPSPWARRGRLRVPGRPVPPAKPTEALRCPPPCV